MPSVYPPRSFTDYFGVDHEPAPPKRQPKPVKRYTLKISCPECGGTDNHESRSKPNGLESRSVIHCPPCHRRWLVTTTLKPTSVGK